MPGKRSSFSPVFGATTINGLWYEVNAESGVTVKPMCLMSASLKLTTLHLQFQPFGG